MNIPETNRDIDLIERYLDGDFTLEEQKSFNIRLTDDREFKDLVETRKESNELWFKARVYSTIKEDVNRIHKQGSAQEKNILRLVPSFVAQHKYYSIAAIGLFLTGLVATLLFIVKPSQQINLADNARNKIYQIQKSKEQPAKAKLEIYHFGLVVLLKPEDGMFVSSKKTILFQWKYNGNSPVSFTISDTQKNSIYIKAISFSDSALLLPSGTLKPGTYKWFIGDQKIQRTIIVK